MTSRDQHHDDGDKSDDDVFGDIEYHEETPLDKKPPGKRKAGARKAAPAAMKYKKAPEAPRRFKSSFIFYSTEKHKEIRAQLEKEGKLAGKSTTDLAKIVSDSWKGLNGDERKKWEDKAERDKARYEMEKSMYKGPWTVPALKRKPKDPNAPKRPMSAFLSYSNSRRAMVKRQNPSFSNAEVSKELARMWRHASQEAKKVYIEEEARLRQEYKQAISEWQIKDDEEKRVERQQREDLALHAAEVQPEIKSRGDDVWDSWLAEQKAAYSSIGNPRNQNEAAIKQDLTSGMDEATEMKFSGDDAWDSWLAEQKAAYSSMANPGNPNVAAVQQDLTSGMKEATRLSLLMAIDPRYQSSSAASSWDQHLAHNAESRAMATAMAAAAAYQPPLAPPLESLPPSSNELGSSPFAQMAHASLLQSYASAASNPPSSLLPHIHAPAGGQQYPGFAVGNAALLSGSIPGFASSASVAANNSILSAAVALPGFASANDSGLSGNGSGFASAASVNDSRLSVNGSLSGFASAASVVDSRRLQATCNTPGRNYYGPIGLSADASATGDMWSRVASTDGNRLMSEWRNLYFQHLISNPNIATSGVGSINAARPSQGDMVNIGSLSQQQGGGGDTSQQFHFGHGPHHDGARGPSNFHRDHRL